MVTITLKSKFSFPASVARPRRGRTAPVRTNQESVGIQVYNPAGIIYAVILTFVLKSQVLVKQVYDFCIMLVVAAIAALLFRRFNVMQVGWFTT